MKYLLFFFLYILQVSSLALGAASSSREILLPEPQVHIETQVIGTGRRSYFMDETEKLENRLKDFIHPILHGCMEPLPEGLKKMVQDYKSDEGSKGKKAGKFVKSFAQFMFKKPVVQKVVTVAASAINPLAGHHIAKELLPPSKAGVKKGKSSMQSLDNDGEDYRFQRAWNENQCSSGIVDCPKLGVVSQKLLKNISVFIANIAAYENANKKEYFSDRGEVDRVIAILTGAVTRMCEIAIPSALEDKPIDNEEALKSCLRIVKKMCALPTVFHDINGRWSENKNKIDATLSILPLEQQWSLYDFMRIIADNSETGLASSGMNMLFVGPTGTGKTYTAKNLIKYLGFTLHAARLKDICHAGRAKRVESLLNDGKLSDLEERLLSDKNLTLYPLIFVDEADKDDVADKGSKGVSIAELKDKLDQFKRLHFSSLGLTVPGFLNCICTTNNEGFFRHDMALQGRFKEVYFPPMTTIIKIKVITANLKARIKMHPKLKDKITDATIDEAAQLYANYDTNINMRTLLGNLDSLVQYFVACEDMKDSKNAYHLPPALRGKAAETLPSFLKRIFPSKQQLQRRVVRKRNVSASSSSGYCSSAPVRFISGYSSGDECEDDSSSD